MNIYVTGAAGQVGSTVIDMLFARGDQVVGIDNYSTGRRDNLTPPANLRLVEDTITDAASGEVLFAI
jgi:UDP-glucose 4-epimerase